MIFTQIEKEMQRRSMMKYTELSQKIILAAEKESLPLEINLAGKEAGYYREEFWKLVPEHHPVIYGVDAHRVEELERIKMMNFWTF